MNDFAFAMPRNRGNIIKVIGVGGGGSNAVNHMFLDGIQNVDFIVANTDSQALENSPVPTRVQIGVHLTEGLGAGSHPEVGRQAAEENLEQLKDILENNTKLLFITAGMGGGTGTGAAPVIANLARELNILTVAIVTLPFGFEGKTRREHAEKGLEELRRSVDSLIVINNDKLRTIYGNLGFKQGFAKADEILATATRSIADVINQHYLTNIDLRDARTVLSNSGTALFGSAKARGTNRAEEAITKALDSPLLNDNHIKGSRQVLLLIVSGTEEITMDEIGLINDHIQSQAGGSANIIMGVGEDTSLEEDISVTIVATGFRSGEEPVLPGKQPSRILIPLSEEDPIEKPLHASKPTAALPLELELDQDEPMVAPEPEHHEVFSLDEEATETIEISMEEEVEEVEEEAEVPAMDLSEEVASPLAVEEQEETPLVEMEAEEEVPTMELPSALDLDETMEMPEETGPIMTWDLDEEPASVVENTPEDEKRHVVELDLTDLPLMEFESMLMGATPEKPVRQEKPTESLFAEKEEIQFKVETKQRETPVESSADPFEAPAGKALHNHMANRKERLQAFNYKFRQSQDRLMVDELEKVPAYKRMGMDIEASDAYSSEKKMSGTELNDEDGEWNIRNHNRFLHDNVD